MLHQLSFFLRGDHTQKERPKNVPSYVPMSLASTYHVTSSQQRLGRNRRPRAVHLLPQRPRSGAPKPRPKRLHRPVDSGEEQEKGCWLVVCVFGRDMAVGGLPGRLLATMVDQSSKS